jgi:murein DD-endopeptidase MepM/ murein hydrolase activator NlpD
MIMKTTHSALVLSVSLLALSACTQQLAAPVELKGHQSNMRSGESRQGKYANNPNPVVRGAVPSRTAYNPEAHNSFTSQPTNQSVAVDDVGVSELTPPNKMKPLLSEQSVTSSDLPPAGTASAPVSATNPWTKKPRELEKQAAPESSNVQELAPLIQEKKAAAAEPAKADLMWPVDGKKVLSSFGPKDNGKANDGINIAANEGDPVWAAADGEVMYVDNELKGYGNMVIIKHANNTSTSYAHLARATVDRDSKVKQGDIIGYVGSTGNVKTPQLFFSVRQGQEVIDPKRYLHSQVAGI